MMAIRYRISAKVVDIRVDNPRPGDRFLVDTNVWLWMAYSRLSLVRGVRWYQSAFYPNYTNAALGCRVKIFHSGLSLVELSHVIENCEWEIYKANNNLSISKKEYRHNLISERNRVCAEIHAACGSVRSAAAPLDLTIDEQTATNALRRLSSQRVDGYDSLILESMQKHRVEQVITDDGDFATVPGLYVFTANQRVIEAANSQGMSVIRP